MVFVQDYPSDSWISLEVTDPGNYQISCIFPDA